MRPDLKPLPHRMKSLELDDRGYPVPFFVAYVNGKPEFRAMDPDKLRRCVKFKLCWVHGEQLGRFMTFVVGPMCGINRNSAEPPSHLECGRWSAVNCPFLSNAGRVRREDELIDNKTLQANSPGIAITRNPGVTLLWTTKSYKARIYDDGLLFTLGDPEHVQFYANGKLANRSEILASIESGVPHLRKLAEQQGPEAIEHLDKLRRQFEATIP